LAALDQLLGVIGVANDINGIVERERVDRVVVALNDARGAIAGGSIARTTLQGSAMIGRGTLL